MLVVPRVGKQRLHERVVEAHGHTVTPHAAFRPIAQAPVTHRGEVPTIKRFGKERVIFDAVTPLQHTTDVKRFDVSVLEPRSRDPRWQGRAQGTPVHTDGGNKRRRKTGRLRPRLCPNGNRRPARPTKVEQGLIPELHLSVRSDRSSMDRPDTCILSAFFARIKSNCCLCVLIVADRQGRLAHRQIGIRLRKFATSQEWLVTHSPCGQKAPNRYSQSETCSKVTTSVAFQVEWCVN
ncbi:hypothetical protein VT84_34240 [Gemmata sp. SH-PL17]|nr:hypothetical protein VT84_34240 [Gemmata sp. SH-PL17]